MPTIQFNYAQMSVRVQEVLRETFGPNVAVRTEEAENGQVYVRLVSDRFDRMTEREKQTLVGNTLRERMGVEAQAVALVLAFGMDQI